MRVRLYGASGALLSDDVVGRGQDVGVGLDRRARRPVARAVLSATVPAGALRIGVLGVGDWTVTGR